MTLFIIACLLYFLGRAPYMGQWDSFDYLKQIVTHRPSDLGAGRPVFVGYNIILWEAGSRLLGLEPLQVGVVVQAGVILAGALGVVAFDVLCWKLLPPRAAAMATLGLLVSPLYALYSGYVMTEVPMLAAAVAAAALIHAPASRRSAIRDALGGVLFGLAVGIREQALTLGAAYLWLLWISRPDRRQRLRALAWFSAGALVAVTAPVAALYTSDPEGSVRRVSEWFGELPVGGGEFPANLGMSLLHTLAAAPAAWLACLAAAATVLLRRRGPEERIIRGRIPSPYWGAFCCLVLPLAVLWRDADVQIHPRYVLVVLPASLILCAALVHRWLPGGRTPLAWAVLHLAVFGTAMVGLRPLREFQNSRMDYARRIHRAAPGGGLFLCGSYSPILDFYREAGDRPQWRILWSGWDWERSAVDGSVRDAWARGEPVYVCDGPGAWLMLERERLELHGILRSARIEDVFPEFRRALPP